MSTTNTPFEEGLEGFGWTEKDDGSYVYGIDDHWQLDESTAELLNEQIKSLTQLHKAAIVAELEQFSRAKCICNETDTLMCDSYWHHSNAVEDRIEQYKKEEK